MTDERWEEHADWWIEHFTEGADAEYVEQIVPLAVDELAGATRVLDVGCGDGQIARAVARAHGADVVGIDPTGNQLTVAKRRGGGPTYARAVADSIPVAGESVDAAIACLVFEHIDALDAAVAEIARALRPGGRFALFLNHPVIQVPGSGWIDDHTLDPPEQYWRLGPYLVEHDAVEQVQHGIHIRFVHRPISRYVNALVDHGFAIERMLEPPPPSGFLQRAPEYEAAAAYPRLLYLRARRTGPARSWGRH